MFLFSPLTAFSAEKEDSFLSGFLTKFEMFRNVTGQLYTITTDVTSVIVSRKYSGISRIGINSENIYLLSGKFVLLPDGLNISLGYSTTTTGFQVLTGQASRKTCITSTQLGSMNLSFMF